MLDKQRVLTVDAFMFGIRCAKRYMRVLAIKIAEFGNLPYFTLNFTSPTIGFYERSKACLFLGKCKSFLCFHPVQIIPEPAFLMAPNATTVQPMRQPEKQPSRNILVSFLL